MSASSLLIEPHYLPSIPYFREAYQATALLLEIHGRYQKQTYQNRCYILGLQGVQRLVIPILHPTKNRHYKEVAIDYRTPWYRQHVRALATVYGKAPYYHAVMDFLSPILAEKPIFLHTLTTSIISACFSFLQLKKNITTTNTYALDPLANMRDARYTLHPKREIPSFYGAPVTYLQAINQSFVPNLSIVDLLMYEGPNAHSLLAR